MRIAIAAPSSVPFRLGGAERAWNGLLRELIRSTPHQADLIKLPSPEQSLLDVVRSYEAFVRLDLSGFDLLITTKYPAWITRHEQHIVYLFHPLRALYDLYPPGLPRRVEAPDKPVRALERLLNRRAERELLDEVFGRFHELVAAIGPHDPVLAFPGPLARELVHFFDRVSLDPRYVTRHLALSRTVAGRPDYFPAGVEVEVLYLPPNLEGFSCRGFQYLFTPSRLEANKRVDLLVEAMRHVSADILLRIGGTGPERDRLQMLAARDERVELLGSLSDTELLDGYADALAVPVVPRDEELGLVEAMRHVTADVRLKIAGSGPEGESLRALARDDERVEFLGSLSDTELLDGYADALAVPVVPHDEELGLVTLEAMRSGKPVITCRDSGGPTELVEHGRTGLVTEPTPQAIAAAIDRLAADPALARRLGEAGRRRAESVTWHRTVTRLLQSRTAPSDAERRPGRPKVVIASTARVHPARTAAERRTAHLAEALAAEYDVEIVSLGRDGDRASRDVVMTGVVETLIPRSRGHAEAEMRAAEELGLPLHELFAAETKDQSPEYVFGLARACRSAAKLILSRPYLQPAAAGLPRPMPFVYHAHRAEAQVWGSLLPETPLARQLQERVRSVERHSLVDSEAVLVSAPEDVQFLVEYGIDPSRPAHAPLGLDPAAVRPVEEARRAEARDRWLARFAGSGSVAVDRLAVFLGSGDALDVEAGRRLAAVAGQLPEVLHVVVGCRPEDLGDATPANVVVVGGLIESMRTGLLGAADVSLFPGAHPATRLELAESLAAGVPCVATTAGAYGLPLEDGVHALVRELPAFPDAVRQILAEPALAERLSRQGRHLVERHYGAEAAARRAVVVVREAIEAASKRQPAASL